MPPNSIYNKNFGFVKQKCISENYRKVKKEKNILIVIIFVRKKNSADLFRAAPYRLLFVLRKDAPFHFYFSAVSFC
jgi:hypothetical protein